MNIFHFSEGKGRKLENFKGIPRRVKIDRKKTMFRNAKYIKGILYACRGESETFPRHESPYGCSHTPPTHNIANITLAPSCGNTLLFINDRRKCRSRLINALVRLLRFESFSNRVV